MTVKSKNKIICTLIVFVIFNVYPQKSYSLSVKNFEIENIKVGDSIYDHFEKKTVKRNERKIKSTYKSKKYQRNSFKVVNPNKYKRVSIHYDENKKIAVVAGIELFRKNSEICYNKEYKIFNDISKSIPEVKVSGSPEKKIQHKKFKDSYFTNTSFLLNDGVIRISCYYWGKKTKKKYNWVDNLRVVLMSKEFKYWLDNEAF